MADQAARAGVSGRAYELPEDGNEEFCGACRRGGTLLCCELCPAAFHFTCAGYGAFVAVKHPCSCHRDTIRCLLLTSCIVAEGSQSMSALFAHVLRS